MTSSLDCKHDQASRLDDIVKCAIDDPDRGSRDETLTMNFSTRPGAVTFCGITFACLFFYCVYMFTCSGTGQVRQERQQKVLRPPTFIPDPSTLKFWREYRELPSEDELQNLTEKQIHNIYHSYLDNTEILCHRKLRVGSVDDGGWEMCDDYEFRPVEPCVVYSFGINFDFSFDDEVAVLYGCKVYSFDPSMGVQSFQRSPNVFFYNIGLGGRGGQLDEIPSRTAQRNGWKVRSFSDIRAMLKHQQTPIDIVKMDIEESEWVALADMARTGELTNVRQLFVEFHLRPSDVDAVAIIRKKLSVLKQLEEAGFKRFYTHTNPRCDSLSVARYYPVRRTTCYETYFLNSKFVRGGKDPAL